ncbi:MAG TPA: 4-hydroxy-3-methylbut-2-enyl diphosphate reductase [Candidatus Coproplasma stercoripullorum]|uniref:4-hydroxy-3-methylbut-2-enyl diphosphate reductase n=1 Tax=Candidatus Coproplasma stercoripullorum TaxID=2840751 RepID=A0A9D1AFL4_9FIRM|nr:4-hydroxy-3-methylbut-2-enyl diphosphate reductase [Candidatus Coproplasma stercoripullorum]
MNVILAKNSGFCSGVRRAVDTAMGADGRDTYVLGEIIHNKEVIESIEKRGVKSVESLEEVPDGATVIFRSHGVPECYYGECARRGIKILDCTCEFVRKTQRIVSEQYAQGKAIVIIGEAAHPEVKGLLGWCDNSAYVINSENAELPDFDGKDVIVVCQTTFSVEKFEKIIENIKKQREKTVAVFKTICYTTIGRQAEAEKIAAECDAVLVIGGLNSSNTNKLFEVASKKCANVFRLANADDFDYAKLKNFSNVGIVSGASTPDAQTREVLLKMEEVSTEVKATESAEEEKVVAEAAEAVSEVSSDTAPAEEKAVVEEASAKVEAKEEAPLNPMDAVVAKIDSESKFKKGQIVKATISEATDDGIKILLPFSKSEILLPKEELDCDVYSAADYAGKVGEQIDLLVVELRPSLKLSQKMIKLLQEEEALSAEIAAGKEFSITCTGYNKGGLVGNMGTYQVFVPAKEIRPGYVKDLSKYEGKTLRLRALEIKKDSRRKEIIASQRVILQEEKDAREAAKAAKEEAFFASINVGDTVEGKVERVTDFGAFVSVNGFDCLAHISDLSWTGIDNVTDVLEIGKTYNFLVLKVDKENKKVSIGYKQLQPQPWDLAAEKYAVGDVVHGKVVRIVPFGAFVEVEKGIDGLVHVSQISHERIETPASVLNVGDEVDAKIMALDTAAKKMNLSIKALLPEAERKPRAPREDGEERPARRRAPRRDDGEMSNWSEGASVSTSLADILANAEKNK